MRPDNKRTILLWVTGVAVILATTAAYWPGLHGPFVFDDLSNIILVRALRISTFDFRSLSDAAFWQKDSLIGRPVANLSFALNYYFAGFNTFAYKTTNLAIHLVNGALLFWLTRKLLGRVRLVYNTGAMETQQHWWALAIAGLWLLHPLNLTSVLYVVQRMASLCTLFLLLGLAGYIVGREKLVAGNARGFGVIAGSMLGFGTLAILTKENGVLLAAYAFVIEVFFYRFSAPAALQRWLKRSWLAILLLPLALLAILGFVMPDRLFGIFSYQYRDFTMTERLLTEARAIWFYLTLIVIPDVTEMGVYHDDFAISHGLLDPPSTLVSILGCAVLAAIAILGRRRFPVLGFGLGWFLVGHSIESTILPLELVHEHRNYLPLYGILLSLVHYTFVPHPRLAQSQMLRYGLGVVFACLLGNATFTRALDWKDEWTFYNRTVINHPDSPRARNQLAIILHDNRHDALAEEEFRIAEKLAPHDSQTTLRLAQHLYLSNHKIPEDTLIELEFRLHRYPYSLLTLWTFEPLLTTTADNPALNLRLIGMYERLIQRSDIVIADGHKELAYRTLAFAYREQHRYTTAIDYFYKAAALTPQATYYLNIAEIELKRGNTTRANAIAADIAKDQAQLNDEERHRLTRIQSQLMSTSKNLKRKPAG
jgi:protein O-mannosyl-transferase